MASRLPIGEAIRRYRGELSREALAARWGVPLGTLRNWEQGIRKPSPEGPIRLLIANGL